MAEAKSVKIGPEFFAKELREYANWRWAFVREALQNCIDAPRCKNSWFNVTEEDGYTIVTWGNDGKHMDLETIENKLFALGGTGKGFEGTVGGFGKAKTLLYFAQESYEIITGNLHVKGRGGDYTVTTTSDVANTMSKVKIKGLFADSLRAHAERFVSLAQWSGNIRLEGDLRSPDLRKGKHRRSLTFGEVYTNNHEKQLLVVRINGIPMFTRSTQLDRCVVLELSGSSVDRLTSNRDGLLGKFSAELDSFLTELAVDRRSALSPTRQTREFFGDTRVACLFETQPAKEESVTEASDSAETLQESSAPLRHVLFGSSANLAASPTCSNARRGVGEMRFVVYNKMSRRIPKRFLPGESMQPHARKLADTWRKIMIELHRIAKVSASFSIGFVFDDATEDATLAQHELHENESIYYINPVLPNFKKRFSAKDKDLLILVAAHEFVHGQYGLRFHDEDFASRLTFFAAEVMQNRRQFNHCFRT
jgi:hypothetical protein